MCASNLTEENYFLPRALSLACFQTRTYKDVDTPPVHDNCKATSCSHNSANTKSESLIPEMFRLFEMKFRKQICEQTKGTRGISLTRCEFCL